MTSKSRSSIKIISLDHYGDTFSGIFEVKNAYVDFIFTKEGGLSRGYRYRKKDYKNLEHFAGVIGKFNPYTVILRKSVEIDSVNYENLKSVYSLITKIKK